MTNKKYVVYAHINKYNKKIYVGKTCQKPNYRWKNGKGYTSGIFADALKKYHWDDFFHVIWFTDLSKEEAYIKENEAIIFLKTNDTRFGYNCIVNNKNITFNQETRLKMSKSAMLRPNVSKETKEKLSKVNKNKRKSCNTRKKMSEASLIREKNKIYKYNRPVMCLNTQQVFSSLKKAADWCNLKGVSGIVLVCKNKKQKSAGVHPDTGEKLMWKYVER